MKKIYTLFLFFYVLITYSFAQVTIVRPTGENTGVAPWSVTSSLASNNWTVVRTNIANMTDGDLSTSGTFGLSVPYLFLTEKSSDTLSFTIPAGNNGTVYVEMDKDATSIDYQGYNELVTDSTPTEGVAKVELYNGNAKYNQSAISIDERTKPDGTLYYAVHANSYGAISKFRIVMPSNSLSAAHTSDVTIKDVYWYTGTADITDCGNAVNIMASYQLDGLPLGAFFSENLNKSIDVETAADTLTYTSDWTTSIAGVGFFYFIHNIYFNGSSNTANSTARIVLGNGINLGVNLTGNLHKLIFKNKGQAVYQTGWETFSVLNILGIQDYTKQVIYATSPVPYDEVDVLIGIAGVNVANVGQLFRLYGVNRTPNAPAISSNTLWSEYGKTATLSATGVGSTYVWNKSTEGSYQIYDTSTATYKDTTVTQPVYESNGGLIATTTGTPTTGAYSTTTWTTPGTLSKDSTFFVASILLSCSNDTSAYAPANVYLYSTPAVVSAPVANPTSNAVTLSWGIPHEYKVTNIYVQRRVHGAADTTWSTISTVNSIATEQDGSTVSNTIDTSINGTDTTFTEKDSTKYSYTDETAEAVPYDYRILINDRKGVASNTVVSAFSTLPVTYAKDFAGTVTTSGNVLTWATAQEINNKGFNILRSTDKISWTNIAWQPSEVINGKGTDYKYVDNTAGKGINYYQLQQVDLDGHTSNSEIISLNSEGSVITIYPNPVQSTLYINNTLAGSSYKIVNIAGKVFLSGKISNDKTNIDALSLTPGLYIVELLDQNGEKLKSFKFIKK
ncbi:MAG: T9SS type A sorting domain-containing protein [Arachidicoccus sp.]|nr:T9SS type A sorting domain-containing protein [Arachidicoccus sp.]